MIQTVARLAAVVGLFGTIVLFAVGETGGAVFGAVGWGTALWYLRRERADETE
ncbi:hypothetical protein [Halobaculum sp. MBLA0143]|uniref:hypothetical protein n=1 Tax=Halobaculum sp. MBLA0143 TaxID=3079933 RepID=UPI003526AC3F